MLKWVLSYSDDAADIPEADKLKRLLDAAVDIEGLMASAKPIGEALLVHVISCWDVEFCALYFGETMQAYPLFQLTMPRFAPGIELELETGRLLRNGVPARHRVIEPAMSRFIDFIAVLIAWKRDGKLPDQIPRVKEFASWCNENEARVVSWRDGTTNLTFAQFESFWNHSLSLKTRIPNAPVPMFISAHLWAPLATRDKNRIRILHDLTTSYASGWRQNRDRLVASGLRFGETAWPHYFMVRPTFASV